MLFNWDPTKGKTWLERAGSAQGKVTLPADAAQQAIMTALVNAEAYAVASGLSSAQEIPGVGVPLVIGAARKNAIKENSQRAIYYMAAQGAARQAQAQITFPTGAPTTPLDEQSMFEPAVAVAPIVYVLAVLGVAALVGGAYWAGNRVGTVEAQGEALVKVHTINELIEYAKSGKPLPRELVDAAIAIAKTERKESDGSSLIWYGLGAVTLLGVGAYAVNRLSR